jgi:hypothetical protein
MAWREDRFDVMIFSDKVFPTGGINAQGARRVMYYDMGDPKLNCGSLKLARRKYQL